MYLSLTKLRANLYQVVDSVIATGLPAKIKRNGYIVKIIAEKPNCKLDCLEPHPGTLTCPPEELVSQT